MKFRPLTINLRTGAIILLLFCLYTLKAQVSSFPKAGISSIPGNDKDGPTVSLLFNDTLSVPSYTEFSIPVIMKTGQEISAISLGLYYPQEFLEITGMELADSAQGFNYSDTNGLFTLAWSDVNPINIINGGAVMYLRMKSLDLAGLTGTIKLGINEYSEFADKSANVIEGVVLEIPEIQFLSPDPDDSLGGNYILVFPNPFDDFTTVNFYLKTESKVRMSLFNMAGLEMLQLPDAVYPKGTYQVKLHALYLSKGIYLLKFEVINEGQSNSKLIKILAIR
jgi:hypothetical protein